MSMPKVMKFGFRTILAKDPVTGEEIKVPRKRDIQTAEIFAHALNVQWEEILSTDLEYGRKLANGTFTGPVGLLQRNEVDLVPVDLVVTEERLEAAHFGPIYIIEGFTFATRKPQFKPKFLNIVHPFSLGVWISVIICFILMSVVFYMVLRKSQSLERVILNTFGSFLGQTSLYESKRLSKRLLQLSWALGAAFLVFSYTAVLLSFMTLPVRERGVRTIAELSQAIAEKRYRAATVPGIFIIKALATEKQRYIQRIGEDLQQYTYPLDKLKEILLEWDNTAYIVPRNYLAHLRDLCFISEENFFLGFASISYSKEFCCPEHITMATLRITEAGFNNKINDEEIFDNFLQKLKPNERFEAEPEIKLLLEDMSGAFGFLVFGIVVSIFVFLIELAVKKFRKAKK